MPVSQGNNEAFSTRIPEPETTPTQDVVGPERKPRAIPVVEQTPGRQSPGPHPTPPGRIYSAFPEAAATSKREAGMGKADIAGIENWRMDRETRVPASSGFMSRPSSGHRP